MGSLFSWASMPSFINNIIRISTPLVFGALSAVITQKSGVLNMAIESMMLASSLTGVLVGGYLQNVWLGLLAGVLASVIITLILSYCTFSLKVDLYLASIAMNTGMSGATVFIMYLLTGQKASTVGHLNSPVLPNIDIAFIKDIPVIGEILSGHNILTYVAIICTLLLSYLLKKTVLGLRIRSVGENPAAATSVGIDPIKIYYLSFAISGIMAGLGGCFMSMGYVSWFQRDITAGRGYIGMSATNITGADPIYTAIASVFFGAAQALANRLQLAGYSVDLISSIPYIATILILIISATIKNIKYAIERKKAKEELQKGLITN